MAKKTKTDGDFEVLESEEQDRESSPAAYEILSYPADFTLEVLVSKWKKKNEIVVPDFQRRFVWKMTQSSRLIESFLLGLPVPPVFMYLNKDNQLLVVDGQQRLKTVAYFFEGYFGPDDKKSRPIFRLQGLDEKSPFSNKTYEDIKSTNPAAHRRLNDAVLRSFVIKQLDPKDDTSIYYIFERLNTGGTLLHSQEIRNAIYYGPFNEMLRRVNKAEGWRALIGRKTPDDRLRDVELILRFFALQDRWSKYEKPMKEFLNKYMAQARTFSDDKIAESERLFNDTLEVVAGSLGEKPFHVRSGLNIAVFDSVFPAFASHLDNIPKDIKKRYAKLIKDGEFNDLSQYRTSDTEVVKERRKLANKILFG